MIKKHHTPKFIYSRLKQKLYEKKHPDNPWMTPESIKLMHQLINAQDIGLEYGSGRSTFWFAKRCKHLTSVEHNEKWFGIVNKKISMLNNLNVDYSLQGLNDDPLKSNYYRTIDNFDNESLDFVIVDGKYRDILSLKAIEKLKKGGLLILDNAERYLPNDFKIFESMGNDIKNVTTNWKKFIEKVENWRKIWTCDGISSTYLLIKT